MRFDDVVPDIKRLVGVRSQSIRRGAELTIVEVDVDENRLELIDARNRRKSRSLAELERVWEALSRDRIVHVDSVLGGSGSSRNQPETILANLPYVEWLIHNGKKHLSYVGRATHPIGTLRRMDPLESHELLIEGSGGASEIPAVIIVTEDVRATAEWFERLSGRTPNAVAPGVYHHDAGEQGVLLVGVASVREPLTPGTYVTIQSHAPPVGSLIVEVAGACYHLVDTTEGKALVHSDS